MSSLSPARACRGYSLVEIQSATNNFDKQLFIGEGGYGKVYKGHICDAGVVAIKRLDSRSQQGSAEFMAEIENVSKLRHCNLVSLIGYCHDKEEMILVYEYVSNDTLYHHLHKAKTHLNWLQLLKIGIGTGRAIDYLHTGVDREHGIIHRDVKTTNILLDDNCTGLISDFGLSIKCPANQPISYVDASLKGTVAYIDPECFKGGRPSRKTDVFAFGVVLFEMLSGRLVVDASLPKEQRSLVMWAQKCLKEGKLDQLVDSRIRVTIAHKCLRAFVKVADSCLRTSLEERPTMSRVVAKLQSILAQQEKSDKSAGSSCIKEFVSKMCFLSSHKGNSDHGGSNSPNMNQCSLTNNEIVAGVVKVFTYDEIQLAIWKFGNHKSLGKGNYGKVYKGWVDKMTYAPCNRDTGFPIAIKKLHRYHFENPERFELDMKLLRELSHPNLVKLIGYCLHDDVLFLAYEFMANGSLEDHLLSGKKHKNEQLPLVTKVKIMLGIARALVFLQKTHDGVDKSPLDRHNILLDEDFTAKLSDYDVVKLVDGHYPPVNPGLGPFELQSDLHGFTVVFAEVLTGKQFSDENELQKMNDLLFERQIIKYPASLNSVAKLCFEICNEKDSESKMLRILDKFDNYIPP